MPRYPGARWEPIVGGTDGPMREYRYLVLHVNDSVGADLFGWENHGVHDMSSHFQVPKTGAPFQYLDTNVDSWCQEAGNTIGVSVETEGYPTEPLTSSQLVELGKLAAWLHAVHGIPLQVTDDPLAGAGLITHGAGGAAWGGHYDCPGPYRKAQRAQIIALAQNTQEDTLSAAEVAAINAHTDEKVAELAALLYGNPKKPDPTHPYSLYFIAQQIKALHEQAAGVDVEQLAGELATKLGPDLGAQLAAALAQRLAS